MSTLASNKCRRTKDVYHQPAIDTDQHRHRGADLVFEAFGVDLGGE